MTFRPPPPGWHTFGSHANYEEDFGEPCPPLVFSTDVDEAGMPYWERIDPAGIRRATAIYIAEETLPLLDGGHNGCVAAATDSLRRYLPTPLPELDVEDWDGPTCYGCGARLSTAHDPDHFLPMSVPDAEGYQCRSSYVATGETPSQAWCAVYRRHV